VVKVKVKLGMKVKVGKCVDVVGNMIVKVGINVRMGVKGIMAWGEV